jgi:hypothetical protein
MELTMPCTHFNPASITDRGAIDQIGNRAISGSVASRLNN